MTCINDHPLGFIFACGSVCVIAILICILIENWSLIRTSNRLNVLLRKLSDVEPKRDTPDPSKAKMKKDSGKSTDKNPV